MRDPESQTPATTPGLQALSHYHGSPWLKPVPVPERKGSKNPKQPPDTRISAKKLLGKVRWIGDTEWEVPCSTRSSRLGAAHPGPPRSGLLARELQSWGCSPGASRPGLLTRGLESQGCSPGATSPGAARLRPPGRGLLDRSLQDRGSSPGASWPRDARPGPPGPGMIARVPQARGYLPGA